MKKFKMPDSFSILFIIIVIISILTWIIPAGEYVYECNNGVSSIEIAGQAVCPISQEASDQIVLSQAYGEEIDSTLYSSDVKYVYQQSEQNRQGLWQIFNAPVNGFYDAVDISLFIIVIGGFLNIVMQTGALNAGIGKLLKKFAGKERMLIPILMILFGIGGTTFGMCEETIAFFVLIIPVMILAGYDSMVGFMVITLGAGVGVLVSTTNPFAIGVASSATGVSIGQGLIGRLILLAILEGIAIWYTMRYAKKVKSNPEESLLSDINEEINAELLHNKATAPELTKAHRNILIMFASTFLILILGVVPWSDFGITAFEKFNDFANKLSLLGGTEGAVALGTWWFGELTMLFLVSSFVIGIYARSQKLLAQPVIDAFIEGAKDLLSVALIVALARGIGIVLKAGGMDATLLYYGSHALSQLGQVPYIIGTYLFFIPMSFLIPSTSGLAAATMPVMGPLSDMIYGSNEGIIYVITSFSAASGLVNLITPTSGVIMGGLALSKIPYDRWVKAVFPLMIILSIAICVFLSLGSIFNFVA